jgi:Uma2 family endonuclease
MTTKPTKPLFDPPPMRQLSIEEAPHLYEDGVYYPGAAIPGFEPEVPPVTQPSIEEAPHLYEDGVFYPATDGAPLPDGAEQYHEFLHVNTLLQIHYADQPRTIVSGNTFIYYDQGRPGRNIAPDCYVAFDVNRDEIISQEHYRIWVVGKPPDFALEIASKHTAHNDLVPKRELYAAIGIGEYWRYDPTEDSRYYGERLVGERLVDGKYQAIELRREDNGDVWSRSEALGVDFYYREEDGVGDFLVRDSGTGEWLNDLAGERAAREVAEARAQAADARAEAAEAELDRLRRQQ